MDLKQYKLYCSEIENSFKKLKDIADNEEDEKNSLALGTLIKNVTRDDFKVVVVGEFSRGKSTFVNALLGTGLLPTSSKPTTAVITEIVYDKEKFIHVYNDENNYTVIPEAKFEEFKEIKAPKESLGEESVRIEKEKIDKIYKLEIHYPIELCKNKVMLIDTPGLNDKNIDREEITKNYLIQADAAIVILSCNQALSKSEHAFISYLKDKEDIKYIFFVLNFKDQANHEVDKVLKYIKENLADQSNTISLNKRIYAVNSKGALVYRRHEAGEEIKASTLKKFLPKNFNETGFLELEKSLKNFLANEKGRVRIKKYIGQMEQKIKDLTINLITKKNILKSEYMEVAKKVEALEPKFLTAKNDTDRLLNEYSDKARYRINDLMGCVKKYEAEVKNEIFKVINNMDEDDLTEAYLNTKLKEILTKYTDLIKRDLENIQRHDIALLEEEYYQKLSRVWKNIGRECRETFEVNSGALMKTDLRVQPDVSVGVSGFNSMLSSKEKDEIAPWLIGGGIGLAIAGAPLLPIVAVGAFLAHVFGFFDNKRSKIKNNVSKVITEFFDNLKISLGNNYSFYIKSRVDDMTVEFKDKIIGLENQLFAALEEKKKSKQYTDECVKRLDDAIEEIKKIQNVEKRILEGVKE